MITISAEKENEARPFQTATEEFLKRLKTGIYKELHKKGLLTKKQLDSLNARVENGFWGENDYAF